MKNFYLDLFFGSDENSGRANRFLAGLTIVILLFATYSGWRVQNEIGNMTEAKNDVIPWNLGQLEIEFIGFSQSLRSYEESLGRADSEDVERLRSEIRTRFDIFYSRVATINESDIYRMVRTSEESSDKFRDVLTFTFETSELIDTLESLGVESIGRLREQTVLMHPTVRQTSLTGVKLQAIQSESYRQRVFETLAQYWLSVSGLFLAMTIVACLLWITARALRKQTVETLAYAARLKAVFDASPYPILVVDGGDKILDVNKAAEVAFRYSWHDLTALQIQDILVQDSLNHNADDTALRPEVFAETGQGSVGKSLLARRRDGSTFQSITFRSTATEGQSNDEIYVVRDITETLRHEKELLESRDHARAGERAKERLLAVVSHEMRTPLHAILGAIEQLDGTWQSAKQEHLAGIAEDSARNLLHQVDNLLLVARDRSIENAVTRKPFDLRILVEKVIGANSILATRNGNHLALEEFPQDLGEVIGDPDRLRQILVNLVSNAVKFTKDGRITLKIRKNSATGSIDFEVRDTGIGIAQDGQERIFEDFYSTNWTDQTLSAGTGLGLGITRRFTESMGGSISVESGLGKGSRFYFSIPLEEARTRDRGRKLLSLDPRETAERIQDANIRRILVAEDDKFSRSLLRDGLHELGFEVSTTDNGRDAVRLAEQSHFDCIILDVNMPRLGGLEAASEIRSGNGASCSCPIIALTAHVFPEETERASAAGIDMILTKPILRQELLLVLLGLPENASAATPLIDETQFQDMIGLYGPAIADEVIWRYHQDCIQRLDALDGKANSKAAQERLLKELHTMAGSSALIGAQQCVAKLGELETLARSGKFSEAFDELPDLRSLLELTVQELQESLGNTGEPQPGRTNDPAPKSPPAN